MRMPDLYYIYFSIHQSIKTSTSQLENSHMYILGWIISDYCMGIRETYVK